MALRNSAPVRSSNLSAGELYDSRKTEQKKPTIDHIPQLETDPTG
jgi:hypothetical protein